MKRHAKPGPQASMFDLLAPPATAATPAAPPIQHALPRIVYRDIPADDPAHVMAMLTLLDELPGDLVVLGAVGWAMGMTERQRLVGQQLRGELSARGRAVLNELQRIDVMRVGQTPEGNPVVPSAAFEHFMEARNGLLMPIREEITDAT